MKATWRTEFPQWILIAAMFALAALRWNGAPDRIPVHWGWSGEVDRYGGKFEGLLGLPLLALGLYLLFRLLPTIDPGRANYPAFANVYHTIRISVVLVMAMLYAAIHVWLAGRTFDMGMAASLLIGTLLIVMGGMLGKIRPNWFMGVRTPWTLTSKNAWIRAHRLGGWVFVAAGILLLAAPIADSRWVLAAAGVVLIGGLIAITVDSYFTWRADPEKLTPADTAPAEDERD